MMEKFENIELSDVRVKITSWEANGYDDSDWDTIYFFPDNKEIVHDPGSTRYYCEGNPEVYKRKVNMTLVDAIKNGIVDPKEVRDILLEDTIKRHESFNVGCMRMLRVCTNVVNIPCKVRKAHSKEILYEGVAIRLVTDNRCREYVIVLNNDTNTIREVNPRYVEFDDSVGNMINEKFIKDASIDDICRFISSINSCSSFSRDWYTRDVANVVCPIVDYVITDENRNEFFEYKKSGIYDWANSLPNKTSEEVERIVCRTVEKYYSSWVA